MKDIENVITDLKAYRQRLGIAAGKPEGSLSMPAWSSLAIEIATPSDPNSDPDIFLSFAWCNQPGEGTKRIERQLSILELSLSDSYLEYVVDSMAEDIKNSGL